MTQECNHSLPVSSLELRLIDVGTPVEVGTPAAAPKAIGFLKIPDE